MLSVKQSNYVVLINSFNNENNISHLTSSHNFCPFFFQHGPLSFSCVRAVPFRVYRVRARFPLTN